MYMTHYSKQQAYIFFTFKTVPFSHHTEKANFRAINTWLYIMSYVYLFLRISMTLLCNLIDPNPQI